MKYEYIYSGPPTRIDGIGNVATGETITLDESHPFILENPAFVAFSDAAKQLLREQAGTVSTQQLNALANAMGAQITGVNAALGAQITNLDNRVSAISQTIELKADLSLYVSATGNDSTGTGSEANPFATIERALRDYKLTNLAGFNCRIKLANGSYSRNNLYIPAPLAYGGHSNSLIIESASGVATDVTLTWSAGVLFDTGSRITLRNLSVLYTGSTAWDAAIRSIGVSLPGQFKIADGVRFSSNAPYFLAYQCTTINTINNSISLYGRNPQSFLRADTLCRAVVHCVTTPNGFSYAGGAVESLSNSLTAVL